jgi:putative transposase
MVRKLLNDGQWAKLEPLLAGKLTDRGATAKNNRLFLEAVLWIMRTGAPWRDLPPELGNWHTTFTRFSRWSKTGVWDRVFITVSGDRDLEEVFFDSTAVRAHLHAAGAQNNTVRRRWAALAAVSAVKCIALRTPLATRSRSR